MCSSGSVRYVFPGGNTSAGFYSFYDKILDKDTKRQFILKGGPGVGKSTLISNVGKRLIRQGIDVEYHCCSSDKDSYDGLLAPSLGIAILDGTAPHMMDPIYPGAVDEIINLGAFWQEEGLVARKEEIKSLSKQTSHLFSRAYNYLAQAKLLNEDQESFYQVSNCLNIPELNLTAHKLIKEIFNLDRAISSGKIRHLFASAITPQGLTNHLPNLFDSLGKRYIITGPAGSGKSTIVKKIYSAAVNLGYQIEAFHCALIPTQLEHLILPELDIGIITSSGPHTYQALPGDQVINTGKLIDYNLLASYQNDLAQVARRLDQTLQRGLSLLAKVKANRDQLEAIYIANMDFDALNDYRDGLMRRIEDLINHELIS